MSEMESDKNFCPISSLFKAGQMICYNSKQVDRTMLSNHFLANQIAGKPVCISCHMIMCWYELTVQFCGASNGMVKRPRSRGIGVLDLCFQVQSPPLAKPGLYILRGGKLLFNELSSPLGLGIVQVKYQRTIKRLKFFFLKKRDAQSAPGMSYFSFKLQKLFKKIFKVLNLKKENFNGSALWYFSCTIPRPKFEKE